MYRLKLPTDQIKSIYDDVCASYERHSQIIVVNHFALHPPQYSVHRTVMVQRLLVPDYPQYSSMNEFAHLFCRVLFIVCGGGSHFILCCHLCLLPYIFVCVCYLYILMLQCLQYTQWLRYDQNPTVFIKLLGTVVK